MGDAADSAEGSSTPRTPAEGSSTPRTPRVGIAGYWNLFREGYDELVKAIIRPPRAEYDIEELGPTRFDFAGVSFEREDLQLTNARGHSLHCSMWRRQVAPEGGEPCVIYLHGNASCRAEALQVISTVLATGASLFALDLAACGHSDGDYISLGWYERDDVLTVIEHLRRENNPHPTSTIALWGRSMGAVSAVFQAARDPGIAGVVLDSPFASLEQVALELVTHAPEQVPNAPSVPPFLVKAALRLVASTVKSRANFDLYKLRPVDAAATCYTPALFGTGSGDNMIRPHHSQQIYNAYKGDKNLVTFDGDHNDLRPSFFLDSASIFLKQCLMVPDHLQMDIPIDGQGRQVASIRPVTGPSGRHNMQMPLRDARDALEEAEEAMIRQAMLASLETAGPPAATAEAAPAAAPTPAAPAVEASAAVPTSAPPASTSPTAAPPVDAADDEESIMLAQAIQLSLQEK